MVVGRPWHRGIVAAWGWLRTTLLTPVLGRSGVEQVGQPMVPSMVYSAVK
jgi:hypothetical protein